MTVTVTVTVTVCVHSHDRTFSTLDHAPSSASDPIKAHESFSVKKTTAPIAHEKDQATRQYSQKHPRKMHGRACSPAEVHRQPTFVIVTRLEV